MNQRKSVLFVCLGNICRSPIAEAVFRHLIKEKQIEHKWECDSAAIGGWHVGGTIDERSIKVLLQHGIRTDHIVRQITADDFRKFDYIFGMDKENIKALKQKAPPNSKATIDLLGSYDPEGKLIIHDPYYDADLAGFEECYQISYRACSAFLDKHV